MARVTLRRWSGKGGPRVVTRAANPGIARVLIQAGKVGRARALGQSGIENLRRAQIQNGAVNPRRAQIQSGAANPLRLLIWNAGPGGGAQIPIGARSLLPVQARGGRPSRAVAGLHGSKANGAVGKCLSIQLLNASGAFVILGCSA